MLPEKRFTKLPPAFWANVRTISEKGGYSEPTKRKRNDPPVQAEEGQSGSIRVLGGHEASSDEWTAPEQEAREIRHSLVAYPACVELAAFIGSWFATGAQGGNDK